MKEFKLGEHTYEISEAILQDRHPDGITFNILSTARLMIRTYKRVPDFTELVRPLAREKGLRGFRMLNVHSDTSEEGNWVFIKDEETYCPIQEWVDKYDGKALVLMILGCNPDNLEVSCNQSLVIHPQEVTGLGDLSLDPSRLRVRDPYRGYIN